MKASIGWVYWFWEEALDPDFSSILIEDMNWGITNFVVNPFAVCIRGIWSPSNMIVGNLDLAVRVK
ncbi:hypothetical protein E5D57_009496 [Metarhizium anisopliae]|nr:hypothetical protein E5D57_009496 [Metarhizium anisopliae]